jgi:hypothetical protein
MIYCRLKGGLGNMLFQMAATKSLSIDMSVSLSFPNLQDQLKYLNDDVIHNNKIKHTFEYNLIFGKYNFEKPKDNITLIEYPFHYQYIKLPDNDVMIDGFFQSEKYFKHNRSHILEMFKIPDTLSNIIYSKYSHILSKRLTSVHIRRGDYLKFPNHHPTQSLDYYLSGMNILKEYTDVFLIFSDDIEWCKANIKGDDIIYIEDEKDYIEIYLMSLCNNNIISNSSFSWWGAWLNENENKKIIGPKLWFGNAIQFISDDIIPDDWIKL